MLTAQIQKGRNSLFELLHRSNRARNHDARLFVFGKTPEYGRILGIVIGIYVQTRRYFQAFAIKTKGARVCALAHNEFECRYQCCFACSGFTGKHGKARRERKLRMGNEGEIFYNQLIDHGYPYHKIREKLPGRSCLGSDQEAAHLLRLEILSQKAGADPCQYVCHRQKRNTRACASEKS